MTKLPGYPNIGGLAVDHDRLAIRLMNIDLSMTPPDCANSTLRELPDIGMPHWQPTRQFPHAPCPTTYIPV